MSLVAAYSDSDSADEAQAAVIGGDDDNSSTANRSHQEKFFGKGGNDVEINSKCVKSGDASTVSKPTLGSSSNLLLSATADSGSSESEDEEVPTKRKIQSIKLDNPFRTFGGTTNVSKEDSVFRNPFRDKEEEKIAVLEHHVKMTNNPETALTINGKKICWNYRKRKCYLGTQCPYAHDSDVPLTEEQLKEQKVEDDLHRSAGRGGNNSQSGGGRKNSFASSNPKTHLPGTASVVAGGYDASAFYSSPHLGGSHKNNNETDLDVEQPYSNSKSKKRVGLTNSLIPPKKALNLYHKTKDA